MVNPATALLLFLGLSLLVALILWVSRSPMLLKNKQQAEKTLIEDILKQLYHVEYSGRTASLNDMAGALKIKDRRLVALIEVMANKNLIKTEQGTLRLTESGRDYALKIIRVHRLYEKYLSEKTGIDKLEWHDRAEKMEHRLSAAQTEQLDRTLGSPRFDPHGDPIPTASGEIIDSPWLPLSVLEAGTLARIVHIEDEPEAIYQQIVAKKLHIGSQVKVLSSNEHECTFASEGKKYQFSPIVATNINVVELSNQEVYEEKAVRLSSLSEGEKAKILGISSECRGANRRRLLDLGFINGTEIETEFTSPMKEPKAFLIRNTLIALRNDQSDLVLIEKI
jgi:DtxR family Mn-dependent transcriptional regulator